MALLLTLERGDCCANCQIQCSPDSLFLEILQDSPTCKFIDNLDIDFLVFLNPSQTEDLHKELESLCTKMSTDIGRIEAELMKFQIDPSKPLPKLLQHSLKLEQQKKTKSISENLMKKRHIIPVPVIVLLLSSKSRRNPTGKNIDFFFFQYDKAINKIVIPKFPVVPKTNKVLYLVSHEAM